MRDVAATVRDSGAPPSAPAETGPGLVELLTLDRTGTDVFRAPVTFDDPYPLYGGQVAAQALRAAGLTVPEGRPPHSLHGYFLRSGSAAAPTEFRVERDHDGRSYTARRVVALQRDEVVFTLACSFHRPEVGPDHQVRPAPVAPASAPVGRRLRLRSFESDLPPARGAEQAWPGRFRVRCTDVLPADPLWHAVVLTYLSDVSSGVASLGLERARPSSSLDHAVWFHRPVRIDEWVTVDLVPHTVAGGRGWYTGTVHDGDGRLVAGLAQECLFRAPRTVGSDPAAGRAS